MTKRNKVVNKIMRKEVLLVRITPLDQSGEGTLLFFENLVEAYDYAARLEFGTPCDYMYIPKRALKECYKLRNILGCLNYYCEYDKRLATQLHTTLDSELARIWNKYSTTTWYRKARTIYEIPAALPF